MNRNTAGPADEHGRKAPTESLQKVNDFAGTTPLLSEKYLKDKPEINTIAYDINMNLNAIWPDWRVVKNIGEGSFGKVYEVVHKEHDLSHHAAVKVISIPRNRAEIDEFRATGNDKLSVYSYFESIKTDFVNEIKLMVSLKGTANIVNIEDYKVVEKTDEFGWYIYIRMELLTSLTEYEKGNKLDQAKVIKLGMDICSALDLCAANNIIHRDIKPENIFISPHGSFKLGDFGVARKLDESCGSMTSVGNRYHTAPEVPTLRKYNTTADIYSLGLVLYRLLNNNMLPFLDPDAHAITHHDMNTAVDRRLRGEALPPPANASKEMAYVILKACQFDPLKRFNSASEFKEALDAIKSGTFVLIPPKPRKNFNNILTISILVIIAALLTFALPKAFVGGDISGDKPYGDQKDPPVEDPSAEDLPAEGQPGGDQPEEKDETESILDIYEVYYGVLSSAVDKFGVGKVIDDAGYLTYSGVIYAELIDFNNDGVPELLFIHFPVDPSNQEINFKVYSYLSGTAELLFHEYHFRDFDMNGAVNGYIATNRKNISYFMIRTSSPEWSKGQSLTDTYFTIENERWAEVLKRSWSNGFEEMIAPGQWVNENPVSESMFTDAPETHLGIVEHRTIYGNFDGKDFDMSSVQLILDDLYMKQFNDRSDEKSFQCMSTSIFNTRDWIRLELVRESGETRTIERNRNSAVWTLKNNHGDNRLTDANFTHHGNTFSIEFPTTENKYFLYRDNTGIFERYDNLAYEITTWSFTTGMRHDNGAVQDSNKKDDLIKIDEGDYMINIYIDWPDGRTTIFYKLYDGRWAMTSHSGPSYDPIKIELYQESGGVLIYFEQGHTPYKLFENGSGQNDEYGPFSWHFSFSSLPR